MRTTTRRHGLRLVAWLTLLAEMQRSFRYQKVAALRAVLVRPSRRECEGFLQPDSLSGSGRIGGFGELFKAAIGALDVGGVVLVVVQLEHFRDIAGSSAS